MLKKAMLSAAMAVCALAQAAPASVVNAPGTIVYGYADVLTVEKNMDSGNRTVLQYGPNVQYAIDDNSWTVYNKVITGLGSKLVRVGTTDKYINVEKSNGIYCQAGGSAINFPGVSQALVIPDGCQFWQAAKAVSN